ncbi:hypothetical protein [Mucisphaera calidilacus]|uniref:Dockerin domain-containing protein n=1 Tax=Mucisphaera calidilacus TaxID=2527982 RepID=A0A518BTN3_9BACT|nr:hypothetical protein [Mucisphaera calidilacus]QDU70333.1 hypothetical protein Pan265_01580 [Mucisphaera calidilacus]
MSHAPRITGFSGTGYLRAQRDALGSPGHGTLTYAFEITNSASYQFAFSSRIGAGTQSSEHNDTWVRIVDADGNALAPIPNENVKNGAYWYKVYMNNRHGWIHDASNKDNDPHSLSWNLAAGAQYAIQISSRSKDHLVDRLFLGDRNRYALANKTSGKSANNTMFRNLENSLLAGEAIPGDLDCSGAIDAEDIDLLVNAIINGSAPGSYDLDDSGTVDADDLDFLITDILNTAVGDANLDQKVDLLDLSSLAANFHTSAGWAQGNFTLDPAVDLLDLSALASNFGFTSTIPEPASIAILNLGILATRR